MDRNQRRAVRRAMSQGIATDILQGRGFAMLASIHTEIAPELERLRQAEEYASAGSKSLLENSPETYGQSVAQQQRRYVQLHRVAPMGQTCDCELDEIESGLVKAIEHDHTEESIQTPLKISRSE